jgi:hypothetical protein
MDAHVDPPKVKTMFVCYDKHVNSAILGCWIRFAGLQVGLHSTGRASDAWAAAIPFIPFILAKFSFSGLDGGEAKDEDRSCWPDAEVAPPGSARLGQRLLLQLKHSKG